MRFVIIFVVTIVIGAGVFFVFTSKDNGGNSSESKKENVAKDKAPQFSLKNYEGKEVSLSDFLGQNVIVNSWAVWCPFCIEELKDFAELEHELGEDIVIIAIDRAESLNKVKKYTDDLDVTHDIVFLLDPKDSFYKSIGGFSMPETLFVDKEGNIALHKRGPMKLEEMLSKSLEIFKL